MMIESIEYGGYRIGIPVPFPMKYVYCYLFPKKDGYIVIDTGFGEKAKAAWQDVFCHLGINPEQIQEIYLTHFHPDHSGLCGWMQNMTGAKVLMHEIDQRMMENVWGTQTQGQQAILIKEMLIQHGTPKELAEKIKNQMMNMIKSMQPLPVIGTVADQIEFGNVVWHVKLTPGHSSGHIVFYQENDQIIIIGDHVIEGITPNISMWPRASQTPLQDYLNSLSDLSTLPIIKAYPAHKDAIWDVKSVIRYIIDHHEKRLRLMESQAQSSTAYEIAAQIFSQKELTPHQWRFAIAETIAHMEFLHEVGKVIKNDGNYITYQQVTT